MRTRFLHLVILCSLALAQPLLNVLSANSTFFVAHGSMPVDLFALVLLLEIVIPLLLFAIELLLTAISNRAGSALHLIFIWLLSTLIFLPLLNRTILPPFVILAAALIGGIFIAFFYARWKPLSTFLTFLTPAIVVIPLIFFLNPQIRSLLVEERKAEQKSEKIKNKVPIVFIVLDELPLTSLMDANHGIDAARFPNFARLAHDATWFRDASAVSMLTHSAVPAILTGKYPAEWKSPTMQEYPMNLFTVLEDSYTMHAFETVTRLAPRSASEGERETFVERMRFLMSDISAIYLHIILPDPLAARLPSVSDTWDDFWNQTGPSDTIRPRRDRTEFFARFLKSIQPTTEPQLYFLHLMLPHRPWRYLPSGKEYEDDAPGTYGAEGGGGKAKWLPEPRVTIEGYQRHLLQLCFMDRLLGQLLDQLKKSNLYDRSMIILTADHGISFWPGQYLRIPTKEQFQDILLVPLFVKMPEQNSSRVVDDNVETIDIVPTITEKLGISLPEKIDGISLFASQRKPHPKKMVVRGRLRDFPTDLQNMTETLERKTKLFGSETPAKALFDRDEMIGKPLSLFQDAVVDSRVKLWKPTRFDNVNTTVNVLPCLIAGELSTPAAQVAIAINGIVRAVAQTEPNRKKFRAVVPDNSFITGKNTVEVFVTAKTPSSAYLN